jgi:hypothetical protein
MPIKTVSTSKTNDEDLKDAIRNIYRVYGKNLAAFFADVDDRLRHERATSERFSAPSNRHRKSPAQKL